MNKEFLFLAFQYKNDDIEIVKSNFNLLSQDRKTALSDIENLKDFMKSIKVSISTSPLEVILLDKVAETRKHIQTQRETEANCK